MKSRFKMTSWFMEKILSGDSKDVFKHKRFREIIQEMLSEYDSEEIEGAIIFNGLRIRLSNSTLKSGSTLKRQGTGSSYS